MLENLMNNVIVQSILAICTIIGVPSFLYAIATHKRIQISYADSSLPVIEKGTSVFEKLSVHYDNEQIERLTVTRVAIWNSGNEEIEESRFVNGKSISLHCDENAKILDAKIIQETDSDNQFRIADCLDHEIKLSMDYMNPKDGVVVQVIHTGSYKSISVDCKLKGGNKIKRSGIAYDPTPRPKKYEKDSVKIFMALWLILFFLLIDAVRISMGGGLLEPIVEYLSYEKMIKLAAQSVPYLCMAFGCVSMTGVLTIVETYRIGIPKKLKTFSFLHEKEKFLKEAK